MFCMFISNILIKLSLEFLSFDMFFIKYIKYCSTQLFVHNMWYSIAQYTTYSSLRTVCLPFDSFVSYVSTTNLIKSKNEPQMGHSFALPFRLNLFHLTLNCVFIIFVLLFEIRLVFCIY